MDALSLTHGSLFSGIGGFDLAAEWAGWRNVFSCEIDSFCQTVLKYHFPHAKQYTDIRETDFSVWRGRIDVLSGGFPCQPFSVAGKRLGTEDKRHLWPEMLRAIRETSPRWVVGENVRGIITWSDGLVFEQVCADLEAEGYEVQPYILPVASIDGLIERYRCWFIARTNSDGLPETKIQRGTTPEIEVQSEPKMPTLETVISHDFRSKSDKHGIIDGVPVGLDECSIKGYGNSVVPQLVWRLFDTINQFEKLRK
jgi:DNA-cytosine methyltransferase